MTKKQITYKDKLIQAADGKDYPLRPEPIEMLVWDAALDHPMKRKVYGFANGEWVCKCEKYRGVMNMSYAAELPNSKRKNKKNSEDTPWVLFDEKRPTESGSYLVYWPYTDGRPYYTILHYDGVSDGFLGITYPENIKLWYDAPLSYSVKQYFVDGNTKLPPEIEEPVLAKMYRHEHNNNRRQPNEI